jgi:hypothetical protein
MIFRPLAISASHVTKPMVNGYGNELNLYPLGLDTVPNSRAVSLTDHKTHAPIELGMQISPIILGPAVHQLHTHMSLTR